MVRQWSGPVYGAWVLAVLPVYGAAAASLARWPGQTLLCLWWLRPLFDRVPLYVLSRCLFGAPPGWRQTLRALPGLWWRQLAGALTWRRLDPWRSLHLPVWQLERLRGRERRARLRLLGSGCRRQALGLTAACLLLEVGVFVGLFGLLHMFLPQPERFWKTIFESGALGHRWAGLLWLALFFLALSAVEPFYVGAGFALYLGQRTRFEGWDVEIALRRLAARLAAAPAWPGGPPAAPLPDPQPPAAVPEPAGPQTAPHMARLAAPSILLPGLGLALLVLGQALAPPRLAAAGVAPLAAAREPRSLAAGKAPGAGAAGKAKRAAGAKAAGAKARAGTGAPRGAAAAAARPGPLGRQVRKAVAEVFRAPEFETVEQSITWVPRSPGARAAAESDWDWPLVPRVPRRVQVGLLAAAGAGALAFALLRWRRVWLLPARSRAGAGALPAGAGAGAPLTVHGLDVRPASLPADVPAAAWQLWERGEAAAALGLLYRGALVALMAATSIRFAESWTEGDCLSAVRRHAAALAAIRAAGAAGEAAGAATAAGAGATATAAGATAAGATATAAGATAAGAATAAGMAIDAEPLFARLTASWQAAAYGRREPDAPVMRDLCAGWGRTFGAAGGPRDAAGSRGGA